MPKASLSAQVVLDQAALLADQLGLSQLTMAAIAKHFGVAVPSLYKHVPSLPAVQRELAIRGIRELGAALSAAASGKDRADALRPMVFAYREYARSHPGLYAATLRAPQAGDDEHRKVSEWVLRTVYEVLAGYGLAGEDAVDATRTLRAALHGFVSLEGLGGFGLPQDVDRSFSRLIDALDAAFRHGSDPTRPPASL